MEYTVKAGLIWKGYASIDIKHSDIQFGITPELAYSLLNQPKRSRDPSRHAYSKMWSVFPIF